MFEELKEIYAGKKIFLTGHTGFKGSWFLKILSLLGADVKGYALAPESDRNLYNLIKGDDLCHSVIADLRNKEALKAAVSDFEPDFVFHFAAQPLVRLGYDIPADTFEINAIGTANLLDAVRLLNKPCCCVLITTDKVYHNNEWTYPYRENDRLGGYDPYSASKACAELVIDSYRNSFFNIKEYNSHRKALAVGRAGNVIGGGDWAKDRLIPDIVTALSSGKEIEIRNPTAIRPWQHVLEPLCGYLMLGAKINNQPLKYSQAYNFGPYAEDTLSVEEMVKLAISCWQAGSYKITGTADQPHEAGVLKLDISKVIGEIGWTPKFTGIEAVNNTISWYRSYYDDAENIINITQKQILDYLA